MVTEQELYEDNVPHGTMVLEFDDWSSSQATITVEADTGTILYVSAIRFIVDDAASITAGSIDIAGDNFSFTFGNTDGEFMKLFTMADKSTLQLITLNDGTDYVMVGELQLMPPEQVVAGNSFTITPNTLTMTTGNAGVYFGIVGWTDSST